MQYAYVGQSNEVSLPLVNKATGNAITSGTIYFYLKDIDTGKWFQGADDTFQIVESVAGQATHETDGHWILVIGSSAWFDKHRYRLYAKIADSSQISVEDNIYAIDLSGSTVNPVVPETITDTLITPLYNTKAGLLNKIRMATVVDYQTISVINLALSEVRMSFYSYLGSSRALEIAGYSSSDAPTTSDEILKSLAMIAEVLWVTVLLVDQLPFMVLNNSANVRDDFNDEPLTRDAGALAKYKESLMARINKILGKLENPANDSSGGFQSFSCGAIDSEGVSAPYILADNFVGKRI